MKNNRGSLLPLTITLVFLLLAESGWTVRQSLAANSPIRVTALDAVLTSLNAAAQQVPSHELRRAAAQLRFTPFTTLKYANDANAPLEISSAEVRAVRINQATPEFEGATDHLMDLAISLLSASDLTITVVGLQFTNPALGDTFLLRPRTKIEPHNQFKFHVTALGIPNDPSNLEVKINCVQFEDSSGWGDCEQLPSPSKVLRVTSRINTSTGASPTAAEQRSAQVQDPTPVVPDTRPRVLNQSRPEYTEEARRYALSGIASLRILVTADGSVGQVKVVNGLPGWLTESAVHSAMEMRFSPATKNGDPVPSWQSLDVTFALR
ncbi:MAG TPA: energy transducer TonB [Blastocatellia bacterium]|nr:energy transducer TonB [Blastocatellia bacterium]